MYGDAFGYDTPPSSGAILGFGNFLTWYSGEYDRAHLVTSLRKKGIAWFEAEVKRITTSARMTNKDAVLATLITLHNTRLPLERRILSLETAALRQRDRTAEIAKRNLIPGQRFRKPETVSPETVIERGALTVTQ
jgi:hypothetical protein